MAKLFKDSEKKGWINNDTKQVNVKTISGERAGEHFFYNPLGKRGYGEQGYAGENSDRKRDDKKSK